MMSLLLNAIYLLVLILSTPLLLWRRVRWGKNRRGWSHKLLGLVPRMPPHTQRIWFHAVSVGEVNLLAPLVAALRQVHPDWQLVFSSGTESGFDAAKRLFPQHVVFFCPWDFSWAVRRALARLKPTCLVLTELELWPNLIRIASLQGVKLAIVNGRVSDRSFRRYQWMRSFWKPSLQRFDVIAAQSEESGQRFLALGADAARTHVVGNLKFDCAQDAPTSDAEASLPDRAGIEHGEFVLVAGSTQPEEDRMAIDAFLALRLRLPRLRVVLAPRHPLNAVYAVDYLRQKGIAYWLRSSGLPDVEWIAAHPRAVIVVDVLGELMAWWRRADVAYVGGSQGKRGGQNMIEPAACGTAVCFGPRTENFRDIVQALLEVDAARVIASTDQLAVLVAQLAAEPESRKSLAGRAARVVSELRGATRATVALLESLSIGVAASALRHAQAIAEVRNQQRDVA